jgi:thiol:disulfide interchange protein DsbD
VLANAKQTREIPITVKKVQVLCYHFLLVLIASSSGLAVAADFLPPEQAFIFQAKQDKSHINLSWQIEPGYYLYKQRIYAYPGSDSEQLLPVQFSTASKLKNDRNFGEVAVFYTQAKAIVDLTALYASKQFSNESNNKAGTLTIEYQGCSSSGLCYQPQFAELAVQPSLATARPAPFREKSSAKNTDINSLSSIDDISAFLKTSGFWSTLAVFFLLGAGLSLTPCILPMVPILSGVIVGQNKQLSAMRGFSLSGSYVLGMSASYAVVGVLAASLGAKGNLQIYMQNPWAISIFAAIFVLLALSMFGLYTLQLPVSWQNRLNNISAHRRGGQYGAVFVMGSLAALVASPCVSAPLAGALVYISTTGDKLLGAAALFFLGLGMGLPLLALGAGGGKLLPRAGIWMNQVKTFFGVVLLGVSIWLLARIIPAQITLLLWAGLLIFYAIYTGALDAAEAGFARLRKAASFCILLYGCVLLLGAISAGENPLAPIPLGSVSPAQSEDKAASSFQPISSRSELQQALAQASNKGKLVMLDFYADWCTACIDMERKVFNTAKVRDALQPFQLLQIDITANSAEHRALMDQFGLYGPPSMLFFNQASQELASSRVQGELNSTAFIEHLERVKKQTTVCRDHSVSTC